MSLVLLGAPHCSVGFLKQRENVVVFPKHYQNIGTFSFGTSFFPLIIGILQLRCKFYTLIGTSQIRQN